jgi:hypothetical protein
MLDKIWYEVRVQRLRLASPKGSNRVGVSSSHEDGKKIQFSKRGVLYSLRYRRMNDDGKRPVIQG